MRKRVIGLLILMSLIWLVGCAPTATPEPAPTSSAVSPTATVPPSPTATSMPPTDTPALTDTSLPPTATPAPPTATPLPTVTEVLTAEVGPTVGEAVTLADVLFVRARLQSEGTWVFEVTVQHEDTGWEHYADRWEVLTPDGQVLATRVLTHPHVDEQPFTRSQSGIAIPEGVTQVRVRAHDLVDGYGGREVVVDLTVDKGPDFEVVR
jgi:hypothetical protein